MITELFSKYVTFFPLDSGAPKFFGLSEFFAALALMVLVWTIADVRYRFRVRTASTPLQGLSFIIVAAVGVLALLTDLWRANQWPVPQGECLSPADWQAVLGGTLLMTFLVWTWFAFIRPPRYSRRNAERYAKALFRTILKGSPDELSLIADEFTYSVKSVIHHATDMSLTKYIPKSGCQSKKHQKKQPKVVAYANDILLLIADKRFCRAVVETSPGTALAIFQEIGTTRKYGVQISIFAKNLLNEAVANKDSFLFHEQDGVQCGLLGYIKPLSQAIFSNHRMVEEIGTLLDPDYRTSLEWDAAQWKVYCRVVLITFGDYVENGMGNHSFVLCRAIGNIEHAVHDLYTINGNSKVPWDDDIIERLRITVEFIKDAIKILEAKGLPRGLMLRFRKINRRRRETFYDYLAEMIYEVLRSSAQVRSPRDLCWNVQHNWTWSELFKFDKEQGRAAKVVQFKVRRLIYDDIVEMKEIPDYKGPCILRYCINVLGFSETRKDYFRNSRALQKAVLLWTKKNFAWLYSYDPRIAQECLPDGVTFDKDKSRLVKTSPADVFRREPSYVYFDVDTPATPPPASGVSRNPASTGQPGNAAASIGASKSRCNASDTITASALAT